MRVSMRVVLIGCLIAAPVALRAQSDEPATVTLKGVITDAAHHPVAGATASVLSIGAVRTDTAGHYYLNDLPFGPLILRVSMIGYRPVMKLIQAKVGETIELPITLDPAGRELPTIVVTETGSLDSLHDVTGFTQRRLRATGGHFLGPLEIEKAREHVIETSQLFREMAGVAVNNDGTVRAQRGLVSIRSDGCFAMQIFVDGVAMPASFSTNEIPVHEIRAVEVYSGPATVPAQFRTLRTVCGTIAIWTR